MTDRRPTRATAATLRRVCQAGGLLFLIAIPSLAKAQKPTPSQAGNREIVPGGAWTDTDGNFINAHGGGILHHNNRYYWFGEIKKGKTRLVPNQGWECYRVQAGGVSCYSSGDLVNWKYEGVALAPVTDDTTHDLHPGKVVERPKVIFNSSTHKFVMWLHVDSETYKYNHAGVAVSDKPAGPYRYLGSITPDDQTVGDLTLFKDDDGKAYLIHVSEYNKSLHIYLLNNDYLSPKTPFLRILEGGYREAPAMFKHSGKYYLITSDCTGWSPNAASFAVADTPLGQWTQHGNPSIGPDLETTFHSQSTFVLAVPGESDAFIFMADRWNKLDLEDSRYVWLPLKMVSGRPQIAWKEKWRP